MPIPAFIKVIPTETFYSWVGTLLVVAVFFAMAVFVHRIGFKVVRRLARSQPALSMVLRYIEQPTRLVLAFFAVQLVLWEAPQTLPWILVVRDISALLLISMLTWLGVRLSAAVSEVFLLMHPIDKQDNLYERRVHTQAKVLGRCMMVVIVVLGIASVLMVFPDVRQVGASLLASAGVAGVVVGIAARPVLGNLIAGLQIALTQPIRLDDVVVIQGEWGRIEEIAGSYVVVKLWDLRRLVVPLQWFIENHFQNWTRTDSQLIGSVFLWVDYRMALEPLRKELLRLCEAAPEWDGRVQVLQVFDANERAMQLRILASAANAPSCFDLRCRIREGLLAFIQNDCPDYLPRLRAEITSQQTSTKDMEIMQ